MAAVERIVAHAVFGYTDPKGVYRTALRGERIKVDGDALALGERFGALVEDEADLLPAAEPASDDAGPETSPPGAEDDVDEEDADLSDEESEDDESGDDESPERPPLTANKDVWIEFRIAESEGALAKEQLDGLSKPQLQDDAHIVGLRSQD